MTGSEYCVVGNGPIGAALAHELASAGRSVTLIGASYGEAGMYSAHEDNSRIVRLFHADRFWERMTRANLTALAELERDAGDQAFRKLPVLYRFGEQAPHDDSCLRVPVRHQDVQLPDYFDAQDAAGGVVDPKRYVALLNARAHALGARILRGVVQSVSRVGGRYIVRFGERELECERVVTAAGIHAAGWEGQTYIRAKVLAYVDWPAMSNHAPYCMIEHAPGEPALADVYGVCDYSHVKGNLESKFGFSEVQPLVMQRECIAAWFQRDYLQHPALPALRHWVERFGAQLGRGTPTRWRFHPCAFVTTANGRPLLRIEGGHLQIAGCNGMAAKCCQGLARSALAAFGETEVATDLQLEQVGKHARC
jgi:glycine/D-amino acid oxidase-like deaminating enzyme